MIKLDIIHVTDHAMKRWQERAACGVEADKEEIIQAVRAGRRIPKGEPLPVLMPRRPNCIYITHDGILFILETKSLIEHVLVTVVNVEGAVKVFTNRI